MLYERAILAGLRAHGKIIYCANIAGNVFLRDSILENHYPSQFRFARDPWREMEKFPEIRSRVEAYFNTTVENARLVGAFDAVGALGVKEEDLFETIVPSADYLGCWGQSFKRLDGRVVVNSNLPAIVKRHAPTVNVFAVVVSSPSHPDPFFDGVNQAVFKEITSRAETPVIDGEKLDSLVWSEKIRRTYHLSSNHLMTMFDMPDFVYTGEGTRLAPADTPLGSWLVKATSVTSGQLSSLKSHPLARTRDGTLVYVPGAGRGLRLEQIKDLMESLRPSSEGDG